MTYVIKFSSVLKTKNPIASRFGGSSKYKVIDDELIDTSKIQREAQSSLKKRKTKIEFKPAPEFVETLQFSEQEQEQPQEKKKGYTLNKSKVKRKCRALSRLEKSKKFLAFYSISFPQGLSDEICYKLFNTWLTRCRKSCGLITYLWVAERQKNGTIHFHLLTNDFMPITSVNGFMATSIANAKKKGVEELKNICPEKYNGVDVKKVGGDTKKLINYLSKYITKNEIEFYRLPWHCSRDVSRLFTAINFEEPESDWYFDQLPDIEECYTPITHAEYYSIAGFKFTPKDSIFEDLDGVNEVVYNSKESQ